MNQKQSWESEDEQHFNMRILIDSAVYIARSAGQGFQSGSYDLQRLKDEEKRSKEQIEKAIQQAIQTREKEIVEKFGHFNNGCGCCSSNDLSGAIAKDRDGDKF